MRTPTMTTPAMNTPAMTASSATATAVRMPRGTAVSAGGRAPTALNGTGHLHGRLGSLAALALAVVGALVVTVLMRAAV